MVKVVRKSIILLLLSIAVILFHQFNIAYNDNGVVNLAGAVIIISAILGLIAFSENGRKIPFVILFNFMIIIYHVVVVCNPNFREISFSLHYINPQVLSTSMIAILSSILALYSGYFWMSERRASNIPTLNISKKQADQTQSLFRTATCILGMCLLYYSYDLIKSGRLIASYGDMYLERSLSDIHNPLDSLVIVCYWTGVAVVSTLLTTKRRMTWFVVLLVLISLVTLLKGGRTQAITTFVILMWILHAKYKLLSIKAVLTAMMTIMLFSSLGGFLRTVAVTDISEAATRINELNPLKQFVELSSNLVVLSGTELYIDNGGEYWYGRSIIHPLYYVIVPNLSLKKREVPSSLSVWFTTYWRPDQAALGQGYGFSCIAEPIINFHYYSIPFYFLLLGIAIKYFENSFFSANLYLSVFSSLFLYQILIIVRNPLARIYKPLFWGFFVAYFLIAAFQKGGIRWVPKR